MLRNNNSRLQKIFLALFINIAVINEILIQKKTQEKKRVKKKKKRATTIKRKTVKEANKRKKNQRKAGNKRKDEGVHLSIFVHELNAYIVFYAVADQKV